MKSVPGCGKNLNMQSLKIHKPTVKYEEWTGVFREGKVGDIILVYLFFYLNTVSFIEESFISSDIPRERMRWLTGILSIFYSEKGSLISLFWYGSCCCWVGNKGSIMFLYRSYFIIIISWKTEVRQGIGWFLIFHMSAEGFSQSKRKIIFYLSISHKIN